MDFPNTVPGDTELEKFKSLASLKHKQQFVWCLNALWEQGAEKDAEQWYQWHHKFVELDLQKREEGCELDELNAHRFYEHFNNTHTVRELRDKLREIGWEKRPMMFPFVVFACLEYKADWKKIVVAPQADNSAEIEAAQKACDEAGAALDAAIAAATAAKAAADEARSRETAAKAAADAAAAAAADAKAKADESAAREAELKAAKAEVEAALNEVKAQEEAREKKTQELTKKSEGTGVAAMRAKQELAQHLGEDPLPLRKAKITLEAANRKATKAADAATVAREAAEAAHAEAEKKKAEAEAAAAAAEAARVEAEQRAAEAENAREEAERKFEEAQALLEELKSKPGTAKGLIFWMNRDLEERKKYLPRSKQ